MSTTKNAGMHTSSHTRHCHPLFIIGIAFVPVGVILLEENDKIIEVEKRYDSICGPANTTEPDDTPCNVTFTVDEYMHAPVFVYYGLENYYQTQLDYARSYTQDQLRGKRLTDTKDFKHCDPWKYGNTTAPSVDTIWIPCGLIARSLFNDTFSLRTLGGREIPWTKEGIAWQSDLDTLFADLAPDTQGVILDPPIPSCQSLDNCTFRDPDFAVWMRLATLPSFFKLYRIIEQDVPPGNYTMNIINYYPTDEFDGQKKFMLATSSWIGGRNKFLGIVYIGVGAFSFLMGILFFLIQAICPRRYADTSRIEWYEQNQEDIQKRKQA